MSSVIKMSKNDNSPRPFADLDKGKTKSKKSKQSLNSSTGNGQHKAYDNTGQSSIKSFLHAKTSTCNDSQSSDDENPIEIVHKQQKNMTISISDESDSDFEKNPRNSASSKKKNAFAFMMDSRHKSIGQNSPGKEVEIIEEDDDVETKSKLAKRKALFQDWNDLKGGKKRKVDDKERGVVIEKKLEERAKRLKKMLKIVEKKDKAKENNKKKLLKKKHKDTGKSRKENGDLSNPTTDKGKWRMRIKINLTDDEMRKLLVPKQDKTLQKTANNVNVDNVTKGKNISQKLKNSPCSESLKKVAPVFNVQKKKPKPDPTVLKARKEFLRSDISKAMKKNVAKHQRVEIPDFATFPMVSHVRAKFHPNELPLDNSPPNLNLMNSDTTTPKIGLLTTGCLTRSSDEIKKDTGPRRTTNSRHLKRYRRVIKEENPEYPVYRIFKNLRKKSSSDSISEVSRSNDEFQIWTDLYKPSASKEIFGNQSGVNEIKTWLESWVEYSKNDRKNRRNSNSSSDFESDSEDSRDRCSGLPRNALILVGCHGSGKTMAVYAICNELNINVLEVNASSKRTGKKMLVEIQEATRSHQVKQNENCLNGFLQKSTDNNNKMCVLLIEDIDLVFEQDDGFINAVFQLFATTKRPIILTTTDKNCQHLQKLPATLITFKKPPMKFALPWLQIVCLVEGNIVDKKSIELLLTSNNCDIRTTLLQLQFWCQSNELEVGDTTINGILIEENSNSSDSRDGQELKGAIQRISIDSFQKSPLPDLDLTWLYLNAETTIKDVSNMLEALITTDKIYNKFQMKQNSDFIADSLELTEPEENYSNCRDVCYEWSKTLLGGYTKKTDEGVCRQSNDSLCPSGKHCESLIGVVPLVCHLQRDSIKVDYFSALRTMNRSEMFRARTNQKRNSRFYNYLKGLGLNCSDSNFSALSDVFKLDNT